MSYPIEPQAYDIARPKITIPLRDSVPLPPLPLRPTTARAMAKIPYLVNYLDGTPSIDGADFRLAYDGEALLIVGQLERPSHGRRDLAEDPLQHEQLQILIAPDPTGDRWFRIRMRPHEVMAFDAGGSDAPDHWWTDDGELVQSTGEDGWSFAARVPFALLGRHYPYDAETWGFNIFRMFVKRQEDNASWSTMSIGRPDVVERYGELTFAGNGPSGWLKSGNASAGLGRAIFSAGSGRSKPMSAKVGWKTADGRSVGEPQSRDIRQSARREVVATYAIEDAGDYLADLTADSGQILASMPFATGLRPMRRRAEELRQRIDGIARSTAPGPASRAAELAGRLSRVDSYLAGPRDSDRGWQRVDNDLAALEREAGILAHWAAMPDPLQPSAALVASSLEKIFPERQLPDNLSHSVDLAAPRLGCDSAQVVVVALADDMERCHVTATRLVGPGRSVLASSAIEISLVACVETRRPRYTVDYVGPHPDPLMPLESFDVPEGSHRTLWITVSVPPDTRAGRYKGHLTVKPKDEPALSAPIDLNVWDFSLPVETTLRTAFPMFESQFEEFYGRPMDVERRREYYDFLLRRRISPSCQYEDHPLPRVEDIDYVMDRGANVVSTGYLNADGLDEWIERVKPVAEHLRAKGSIDRAYVYGFDEVIPGDGYPRLKEAYARIREEFPDLPRACTIGPTHDLPELFGTVDTWIPQTDRFEDVYTERQAAGDVVWWYISMWPRHPFANLFIDYPSIDHRMLFWQSWKYGVTGFLYYCINLWSSNAIGEPAIEREVAGLPDAGDREKVDDGTRWPNVRWNTFTGPTAINGDGQLLYPGPGGNLLSSVRLECVRHGIEDYEMLAALREQAERLRGDDRDVAIDAVEAALELLAIPDEICEDLTHYTSDSEALLRLRRQVGDLNERMSRL